MASAVPATADQIRREVRISLRIISGICGVIAAILWFFSTYVQPAPAQGAYTDVVDGKDMPFHKKWRIAYRLNKWAAIMTGISVLLMSTAEFILD
jgi:hypothetical protein